jgi:hydroxyethylthiazole kinase-like uncharacterized protein yjeF
MTELLTAAQMRAIEAAAIASGEVTGLELMERAGRGVVEAVFAEWPGLRAGSFRAVVLCGPGNNGGDGFVVARLLKEWGWAVEVFLYGTPEGMPPDARVNYERWVGMGEVRALSTTVDTWDADLVVDALFGFGLNRGIDAELAGIVAHIALHLHADQHACAVDCPSGLCLDSGTVLERPDGKSETIRADLTVTFSSRKVGHLVKDGPELCGKVVTADIGLSWFDGRKVLAALYDVSPPTRPLRRHVVYEVDEVDKSRLQKGGGFLKTHKFSHGHALILSGPPGHGGAARMAARGALRIGAGLVTVACAAEALAEHAARLDAVMLRVVEWAEALWEVLADARINAVCVGPGLGLDARGAALVRAVLGGGDSPAAGGPPPPAPPHGGEGRREIAGVESDATGEERSRPRPLVGRGQGRGATPRPTVLDADALTLISRDPTLFALLHKDCVLTPHGGEFARLFPDIAAKLDAPAVTGPAYSKVDATREAAARARCVVLFKGADTVIASPDGTCAINSAAYDRSAPWLATAGSGDVLAGFICGLLARGFQPMHAAETAAWLHVECARSFGPGLIAEDLAEEVPKVFRALGV